MKKLHGIKKIRFSGSQMKLNVDGKEIVVNLTKISKRLLKASTSEKQCYEISPAGYGIHWPMIDEDLSIDSLLGLKSRISSKALVSK